MADKSGSFSSSLNTSAGSGYSRYIDVVWSSTNDTTNNKSTISWTAYARSNDSSTTSYVYAKNIVVTINGEATTVIGSTAQPLYKDKSIGDGSVTVSHGSDGTKSVSVSITAQIYVYGATNSSYSGTITMLPNPVYTLSISAGTGSSVTVNRTSCGGKGSTGNLSAGTNKLCKGDKLKITFTPSTNYSITTHTVNSSTFTSGGTHTVAGNVTVVATATPLKSTIGATDANIGSTSTITVTRYNSSYTHTIKYKFGDAAGAIVTKSTNTSIAWTIPISFYRQIPNSNTGICTLTIETFNGSTSLGSSECTLKVTAPADDCSPTVIGTVVDINPDTLALTDDELVLVRYKSKARCTIEATPQNYASISAIKIDKISIPGESSDGVMTAITDYDFENQSSFLFDATDSRGYTDSKSITPVIIPYIQLTINPTIVRPSPTSNDIVLSFSGNYYHGSFGASNNTLSVRYRYKEMGEAAYPDSWTAIQLDNVIYQDGTYRLYSPITLSDNFNYTKEYNFQIEARDGTSDTSLSVVTKTMIVKRGIPVFDWGENDFAFHTPVSIQGSTIKDFIVDEGESGIWTYRKWANGIAECWGKATASITHYATIANALYGYKYENISLPENLFADTPLVNYSANINDSFALCGTITRGITSEKINCYALSNVSGTQSCTFFIRAIGKWNNGEILN